MKRILIFFFQPFLFFVIDYLSMLVLVSHRRGFSYHAAAHFMPEVAHADGLPVQRPAVALCCRPAGQRRNCSLWVILGHPDKKPHQCRQSEGKKPLRKPNFREKNYRCSRWFRWEKSGYPQISSAELSSRSKKQNKKRSLILKRKSFFFKLSKTQNFKSKLTTSEV